MDPQALGRYLRESREAKELTLEDATSSLKIRKALLEAFERGEFDFSDSSVQIRGLLRNYARYLGLDEERVLQYYEAAQESQRRRQARQRTPSLKAARDVTDTPPSLPSVTLTEQRQNRAGPRILRAMLTLGVVVVALGVIAFVSFEMLRDSLPILGDTAPTDSASSIVMIPSATYTASWTPQPDDATPTTDFNIAAIGGVQVNVEMVQRSWLQVLVDGAEQFVGISEPGDTLNYFGSDSVVINAANAAALQVDFNGQQEDDFGQRGQQVEVRFGLDGITIETDAGAFATPTDTSTPQPTPTPLFSDLATPAPTATEAPPTATTLESIPTATETASDRSTSTPTPTPTAALTTTDAPPSPTILIASPASLFADADDDEATTVLPTRTETAQPTATDISLTATTPNEPTETASMMPTAAADASPTPVLPVRATSNPTATKSLP